MPENTWRRNTPVEVLRTDLDPKSPIPIRSAHGPDHVLRANE